MTMAQYNTNVWLVQSLQHSCPIECPRIEHTELRHVHRLQLSRIAGVVLERVYRAVTDLRLRLREGVRDDVTRRGVVLDEEDVVVVGRDVRVEHERVRL